MLLGSCQHWISVGSGIGVFSLRGRRSFGFPVLSPAILSCTVSTNCPGVWCFRDHYHGALYLPAGLQQGAGATGHVANKVLTSPEPATDSQDEV